MGQSYAVRGFNTKKVKANLLGQTTVKMYACHLRVVIVATSGQF